MSGCQRATPKEVSLCESLNYGKQIEIDGEIKLENKRSAEKYGETSESSVNRFVILLYYIKMIKKCKRGKSLIE